MIHIKNNALKFVAMAAAIAAIGTGCLKDKGYDDGTYNTVTGNTTGKTFISIPKAYTSPNVLGLESKAGAQPVSLFSFSYDNQTAATSDVSATVTVNNTLITDATIVPLPTSAYTLPSLSVAFKNGQFISDPLILNINTGVLDPSKKYGIGFTLTGVTPSSVGIPSNLKNAVFVFTIKNKYDGVYTFRGRMDMASDRSADWVRTPFTYPYEVQLITTGPNTVKFYNSAFGQGYHPLMTPGVSGFGQTEPTFTFDASDNLTAVVNSFSPVTNGRSFVINSGVSGSKYDASAKKVYAAYIMNQTGFQPMPLYDTLIYLRAR